ncbi:MAG TPA: nitroreductase family protein [Actinomycetota bacterium]|nr:nitroreductase family protein [Actinomycetota bacterium]
MQRGDEVENLQGPMSFDDAIRTRRSVRAFKDEVVPHAALERAVSLAVQAPAPHHSQPWRFVVIDDHSVKEKFSSTMGAAWRSDLVADELPEKKIEGILSRSHRLLTSTPTLVVCCADMADSHDYPDDRRRRAEWSLFAHTVGAALQTFMTSLATEGVASCWISAPVFCGTVVREFFDLPETVEPHALVLVGYPSPDYVPRPRSNPDPSDYIIRGC